MSYLIIVHISSYILNLIMFLFKITYCVILVYIITKSKLFMKYIQFSIFSNGAELLYVKKKYSVFCFDYGVIVHGFFKFTIFFYNVFQLFWVKEV